MRDIILPMAKSKPTIANRLSKAVAAFTGKSASVSDERGWFDMTTGRLGSAEWNQSDMLDQYGKSIYVFRSVKLIAEALSGIDYTLHRIINTKGDVQEVQMHPILDLMWRPNPFQTWPQFIKITETNKQLTGEAYWYKVRNNAGQVVELWNIRPDLMKPVVDKEKYISHYELMVNGRIETFDLNDIVHLFDTNPVDNRTGLSALRAAKSRVQVEESANEYQRNFFLNNARPDALLSNPETWSDEQKAEMRRDWNEKFQGRGNNSKIAFLEGGTQYQQVSTTQREMDFIESMKFTRDDILVAFGVPKGLIVADDVNRANAETAMYSFSVFTVDPEAKQIFEAVNEQLIKPEFGEEYYLQYASPIPEKREQMITEIEKGVDKWLTRNEARQLLGYAPLEGGDQLLTEFSKVPLKAAGNSLNTLSFSGKKVFRGKPSLYKKLAFQEKLEKEVTSIVERAVAAEKAAKEGKAETKEKPEKVSFFSTTEVRGQYEELINKGIDRRASGFKQVLAQALQDQEARIAARLDDVVAENGVDAEKAKRLLGLDAEIEALKAVMQPVYQDIAVSAGQQANKLIEDAQKDVTDFAVTQVLIRLLEDRAQFFAQSVNETTFEALATEIVTGLAAGEGTDKLRNRVSEVFGDISKNRANLIARTESTFANNAGFQEAYNESKVVNGKEWIATQDARTRDEHLALDGEIVGTHDNFSNGLAYPQEPNCRCVIAPALIKA